MPTNDRITLTGRQAAVYRHLSETLLLERGERVPTCTEIASDTGIPITTVSICLEALWQAGLLHRQLSNYCSVWLYHMHAPNAGYEIRAVKAEPEAKTKRDLMELYRSWEV